MVLIAQALIDSSACSVGFVLAYAARYSVPRFRGNGSVFDGYSPGVADDDRYVGCGVASGCRFGGREDL